MIWICELEKCCPALRTLTLQIHSIEQNKVSVGVREALLPRGPTAIALRRLHSRLDSLSLVTSGTWTRLDVFLQSMLVDGNTRVEEILGSWSLISFDYVQYESSSIRFWMHRETHAYHLFGGGRLRRRCVKGKLRRRKGFLVVSNGCFER